MTNTIMYHRTVPVALLAAVMLVLCPLSPQRANAQSSASSTCMCNDTLDPRPAWDYTQLRSAAIDALAHYPKLFDPVPKPAPRVAAKRAPRKKSKRAGTEDEITGSQVAVLRSRVPHRSPDVANIEPDVPVDPREMIVGVEMSAMDSGRVIPIGIDERPGDLRAFAYDSAVLTYPADVRLLAWIQEWDPCSIPLDSTVVGVPADAVNYRALVWAHMTHPITKQKKWALLLLGANHTLDSWTLLFNPTSISGTYSPIHVFKNWPSSGEIYYYLDQLRHNGGRSQFDFKYITSECMNEWCHCGRFIDADVRENTWTDVTREAPSSFFPNGK